MGVIVSALRETCFLCNSMDRITQEHVFPKWLQNRYELWNQQIVLKNGTRIPYRNLTIPCCEECNGTYLSQIENAVRHGVETNDISELESISDSLFIWLYKIMYGIRYKEMFLPNDRANPEAGRIVDPNTLAAHDSYTIFPLFAKGMVAFDGFTPYSLFVFKIQRRDKIKNFYASEPYKMWVAILLNDIGIVASFQDDGYIAKDVANASVLQGQTLLTISQFADFASYVLFLKARMVMLPNYLVSTDGTKYVFRIQTPLPNPLYRHEKEALLISYTRTLFGPLFEDHLVCLEDGSREIRYTSPFKYF